MVWTASLIVAPLIILAMRVMVEPLLDGTDSAISERSVDLATVALLSCVGAWLVNRGLRLFIWDEAYVQLTGTSAPAVIPGAVAAAIYLLTAIVVLSAILNLDLSAVLISTGLVATVLGVAMQSTITDFFAGISLGIDQPYRPGDWIEFEDGTVGEVVDITWRSTRIRSWNSSLYVVPNKKAATTTVHNYHRPTKSYGYWFHVLVNSSVSPLLVRERLVDAALRCERVLRDPPPIIYFSDLGTHPFKYMVFVHFPDYSYRYAAMDELFLKIHERLGDVGICPAAETYEIETRQSILPTVSLPRIEDLLRDIAVFSPLSVDDITALADGLEPRDVRIGDIIVEQGESGDSMFVVITGIVSLSRRFDHQRHELERLGGGQSFGEMSLLTGERRYATAEAITNVRLIEIPKNKLTPIIAQSEELFEQLAMIVARRRARSEALAQALHDQSAEHSLDLQAAELKQAIAAFLFGR